MDLGLNYCSQNGGSLSRDLLAEPDYSDPYYRTAAIWSIPGPQSMQNHSPKPLKLAHCAIMLHTFGVQVDNLKGYCILQAWEGLELPGAGRLELLLTWGVRVQN